MIEWKKAEIELPDLKIKTRYYFEISLDGRFEYKGVYILIEFDNKVPFVGEFLDNGAFFNDKKEHIDKSKIKWAYIDEPKEQK